MQDTDLFSKILGIKPPWFIKKVELKREKKRVDIYIDHTKGLAFPCPKCEKICSVYDHARERIFRHFECLSNGNLHSCVPSAGFL